MRMIARVAFRSIAYVVIAALPWVLLAVAAYAAACLVARVLGYSR